MGSEAVVLGGCCVKTVVAAFLLLSLELLLCFALCSNEGTLDIPEPFLSHYS